MRGSQAAEVLRGSLKLGQQSGAFNVLQRGLTRCVPLILSLALALYGVRLYGGPAIDLGIDAGIPRFQVQGTGANTSSTGSIRFSNDPYPTRHAFGKSRGALGTNTVVQDRDQIAEVTFAGADGTIFVGGASIVGRVDGTPSSGSVPAEIEFRTGATHKHNTRWQIRSKGTLEPGADATYDIGSTTFGINDLHISDGGVINWANGAASITRDGNTGNINVDPKGKGSVVVPSGMVATTSGSVTITAGAVTVSAGFQIIDTEATEASDDLDTITGGVDGASLYIRAANSARTVVIKDGTGNIKGPGDCSLDNAEDVAHLIFDSAQSAWLVVACGKNGPKSLLSATTEPLL